ncbi:MAG: ABC transporter substrate-binding protein [Stellaceae bacterium]
MKNSRPRFGALLFGAVIGITSLVATTGSGRAADAVRIGKAQGPVWAFLPADVGIKHGLFAKYGIDASITVLAGDAKVQQALAADSIDFGLGGGPGMAFAAKGSPVLAVAAFAGAPRDLCVYVAVDSPIRAVSDLKGKLVTVSTQGSLTDWMAMRLSMAEGWGRDGIRRLAFGATEARVAALEAHQIDADLDGTETGFLLEEKHKAKIIAGLDKFVPDFITHVVFARKELVAKKPDLVNRFLKGFFASIAFMKTHKAETDAIAVAAINETPAVASKIYDYEIPMLSTDGTFDPKALGVLKQSFVDMHILDQAPADSQILTTQFVPVRP